MERKAIEPLEPKKTEESKEAKEARRLDDATWNPESLIEQTGDYKQAEAARADFTALVTNARTDGAGYKSPGGSEAIAKYPAGSEAARLGYKEPGGEQAAPLAKGAVNPGGMDGGSQIQVGEMVDPFAHKGKTTGEGEKAPAGEEAARLEYKSPGGDAIAKYPAGSEAVRLGEKTLGGEEPASLGYKVPGGEAIAKYPAGSEAVRLGEKAPGGVEAKMIRGKKSGTKP